MTSANTVATTATDTATTARLGGLTWWQATAAGVAAAVAVNLLILLVARTADASLVLRDGDTLHDITVGGVIVSSVGPLTAGLLLASLLALVWPGFLRLAQVVGGGLGLLTTVGPLTSDADGGTRLALTLMHVVAGVAAVLALEAIRRRRAATAAG